ncbi:class Ib ribonucleoside-diphosphate reductase assembly flavoprotein NrdI [Brevibacillus daliensis]|uniref:class Ib ribonucleoside-diphosphate reductase assembly flavoprotein NrdI n=1 Tax=Brevibacillus daliensis TaxID=2892995 RepID=UPI001E56AD02|nr:class Ib ribonucleoside-diphosphate reductase assembly flavoprotein NrdI [Brevibacillus daliensis]
MLIAFDSKTGNVKRFVQKLGMQSVQINSALQLQQPYILVTYTTGFGQVPPTTQEFLQNNKDWMHGVVASGNKNWGTKYGLAGDQIAETYQVPLLHKFELSGTKRDVETIKQEVENIVNTITTVDQAQ